ncbi:Probable glutamate [Sparassis crispa]|uniref:Probable glutamate n=1 Tax=Sparassis crispa TaxID=139825 RepID=A0A401GCN1_9APHY|nr:Probable glutamate [Sparassis crispa]GBE79946.1 Probable glutamate [Sparassis crispa]
MADEKNIKHNKPEPGTIPVPVAAAPSTRIRRRSRLVSVLILLLSVFLVFVYLHRSIHRSLRKELEGREGQWIASAFVDAKKRPLKVVPYGKVAEKLFLTVPNPASALAASRQYATKPHLAGSPGDLTTAKDVLTLLQEELDAAVPESEPIYSAGTQASRNATLSITSLSAPTAWIDVYYPVMNTPLDRSLQILEEDGSVVWNADLEEVADETDPEAGEYKDAVPTFHGLSRGGEVQGKLIYANYGRKQDYDELVERGVNFTGSIVIVRYGGVFRGLKVKGAQELGAAGVLIYSDPRDDGTVTEKNGYIPYPYGPARNPTSVQRGSVQYLSIYPGDPTTPGYPSYENSTRTEGLNIPGIPSLPISWANAQVLLELITHPDNGTRTVSLVNHVDNRVIPIWNTMGVIPGHNKHEVIVVGNHRDAWVMGASDPSSGTASMHELIRGLGALLKAGWKPLRTIVLASWDAEEYGLIGSTEWGEDFADWIGEHVVAYLNLDSSVSGSRFGASGSPSLAHFLRNTAQDLPHPTKPGLTLWDATKDSGVLLGDHVDDEALAMYEEEIQKADALGVGVLGSGSDYTVFLQHIGIASTNNGFTSTLSDPVYHYHSVYDSQRWQEIYADPGFLRHTAVAQYLGLQTLRLADAIILPLNTTYYASQLEAYVDNVEELALTSALEVDFSSLRESIHSLRAASIELDEEKEDAEESLKHIIWRVAKRNLIRRKLRQALCKLKKLFGKKCGKDERVKEMHLDADANVASEAVLHKPGKKWRHRVHAVLCKVKKLLGKKCHHHDPHKPDEPNSEAQDRVVAFEPETSKLIKPRIGRYPAWLKEQRARERAGTCHMKSGSLHKKVKKAVHRVHKANKKLVAFEKGLIHEDGIKDREWYRHLGVAPGKWLGYGATTLPALTESITIEKNATLAQYEAARLKNLIDKLADELKP